MAKMIPEDQCPAGPPPWMTTFSDLMSLLLTFFVLLLSFSTINVKEFEMSFGAMQGALGVLSSQAELSLPIRQSHLTSEGNPEGGDRIGQAVQKLKEAAEEAGAGEGLQIEETGTGLVIRIADKIFFDLGEAALKPEALAILGKLGGVMKGMPDPVNVQGHTDDLPISTPEFPSNWELSGMRALHVARYLMNEVGIPSDRLSITGFSEYRPLAPNDTEEHRRQNRRVEIHILTKGGGAGSGDLYKSLEGQGLRVEGKPQGSGQPQGTESQGSGQ